MIVEVDSKNIDQAAAVHSVSWKESHRPFCSPDFIDLHTPERQREYMERKMREGSRFYMLVEDAPVGVVSVSGSLIEDLYVLPEKQNMGYGTEAVKAASEYGMKTLELKRIFLKVFPDNLRAIHVYEKCGFREYDRTDSDVFMQFVR